MSKGDDVTARARTVERPGDMCGAGLAGSKVAWKHLI